MGEYLIKIKGAEFPNIDPEFNVKQIDNNPFGFKRTGIMWEWAHKDGREFSLSPEPPGLQVSFDKTNTKEEQDILKYIQGTIKETTIIVQIT